MAILNMTITSVTYNDQTDDLTLSLSGEYPQTLPLGVREDLAVLQPATIQVGPLKVSKGSSTPTYCIFVNPLDGSSWRCTLLSSGLWSLPEAYSAA